MQFKIILNQLKERIAAFMYKKCSKNATNFFVNRTTTFRKKDVKNLAVEMILNMNQSVNNNHLKRGAYQEF